MKNENIEQLKSVAWFLIKLNIMAVPLYLAVYLGYSIPALQDTWAIFLENSLSLMGYDTSISDHMIGLKIESTIYQIEFSWDSTGWKSLYVISALVFASGIGTLRRKLKFLLVGLPLIIGINMVRVITTVVLAAELGFSNFKFIHDFFWSSLMIASVIAIWYFLFLRRNQKMKK